MTLPGPAAKGKGGGTMGEVMMKLLTERYICTPKAHLQQDNKFLLAFSFIYKTD